MAKKTVKRTGSKKRLTKRKVIKKGKRKTKR